MLNDIMKWNICPNRGWAELVEIAINEGYLWNPESRFAMHKSLGRSLEAVRIKLCDDTYWGPYCWIDQHGRVIPVGIGNHDAVAETLLGFNVGDVEKKFARVSFHTHTPRAAMKFVDDKYKSDAMLLAVYEHIGEYNENV